MKKHAIFPPATKLGCEPKTPTLVVIWNFGQGAAVPGTWRFPRVGNLAKERSFAPANFEVSTGSAQRGKFAKGSLLYSLTWMICSRRSRREIRFAHLQKLVSLRVARSAASSSSFNLASAFDWITDLSRLGCSCNLSFTIMRQSSLRYYCFILLSPLSLLRFRIPESFTNNRSIKLPKPLARPRDKNTRAFRMTQIRVLPVSTASGTYRYPK